MCLIQCRNKECEWYNEKQFNNCLKWCSADILDGNCEIAVTEKEIEFDI